MDWIYMVGGGLYAVIVALCLWVLIRDKDLEGQFRFYKHDVDSGGYIGLDDRWVERKILWKEFWWYGVVVITVLLSPLLILWVIIGEPRFPKVEDFFYKLVNLPWQSKQKEASGLFPDMPVKFSGGDGSSRDAAVVITVDDPRRGVSAEYDFIQQQHGPREVAWKRDMQVKTRAEGRDYDVISIVLADGEKKTYWFDITQLRW
jgi:hypothetical protein